MDATIISHTGAGSMSDTQALVRRYAERFFEDGTRIKKLICVDLLPADLFADDLYGELGIDDDDIPGLFGQWWEEPEDDAGVDAVGTAAFIFEDRGGWIIQAETALPRNMEFDEHGKPTRWSIGGVYAETTVYAPTLPEALERVAVEGRRRVDAVFNRERAQRGLPTPEGE